MHIHIWSRDDFSEYFNSQKFWLRNEMVLDNLAFRYNTFVSFLSVVLGLYDSVN